MLRRLFVPLLGSTLLLAVGATTVLGKCEGPNPPTFCSEVVVSLDGGGTATAFRAGDPTDVNLVVTQGEQPFEASSVLITFARVADGALVTVPATRAGTPGVWHAAVSLPAAGSWTIAADVADPAGGTRQVSVLTIQAADPRPTPPATKPVAPPTSPLVPWLVLLAGGAIGALLLVRDRRARARAGMAPTPVSIGAAARSVAPMTDSHERG